MAAETTIKAAVEDQNLANCRSRQGSMPNLFGIERPLSGEQ